MNWYHFQFWFPGAGITGTTHVVIHLNALGYTVEDAMVSARQYLEKHIDGALVLNFAGDESQCPCKGKL
jgi:hypothetical protein